MRSNFKSPNSRSLTLEYDNGPDDEKFEPIKASALTIQGDTFGHVIWVYLFSEGSIVSYFSVRPSERVVLSLPKALRSTKSSWDPVRNHDMLRAGELVRLLCPTSPERRRALTSSPPLGWVNPREQLRRRPPRRRLATARASILRGDYHLRHPAPVQRAEGDDCPLPIEVGA